MNILKGTADWFRGMSAWAYEEAMLWLTLFVLGLAVAAVFLSPVGSAENRVLWAGIILQILGIATVWMGIEKTRTLFDFKPTYVALRQWLRRIPWRGPPIPKAVFLVGDTVALRAGALGSLTRLTADRSLEARVDVLEHNLNAMKSEQATTKSEFERKIEDLKAVHRQTSEGHNAQIEKVNRKLLMAQTGGLDLSLAGLVWLAVGVVASAIPAQIARLLCL